MRRRGPPCRWTGRTRTSPRPFFPLCARAACPAVWSLPHSGTPRRSLRGSRSVFAPATRSASPPGRPQPRVCAQSVRRPHCLTPFGLPFPPFLPAYLTPPCVQRRRRPPAKRRCWPSPPPPPWTSPGSPSPTTASLCSSMRLRGCGAPTWTPRPGHCAPSSCRKASRRSRTPQRRTASRQQVAPPRGAVPRPRPDAVAGAAREGPEQRHWGRAFPSIRHVSAPTRAWSARAVSSPAATTLHVCVHVIPRGSVTGAPGAAQHAQKVRCLQAIAHAPCHRPHAALSRAQPSSRQRPLRRTWLRRGQRRSTCV